MYNISLIKPTLLIVPSFMLHVTNIPLKPLSKPTYPSLSVARRPTLRRNGTNTLIFTPSIARSTGCAIRIANAVGPMSFSADAGAVQLSDSCIL